MADALAETTRRPADPVRAQNRKRVLDTLRRHGPVARIDLARMASLSPATVTVITADLLEAGLIHEAPHLTRATADGRRGRPRTALAINPDAAYAVGLKVSMHKVDVSLTNMVGAVLGSATVPIRAGRAAPSTIAEACRGRVEAIVAEAGIDADRILGVGVGIPGFVAYPSGSVRWSPLFTERDVDFRGIVAEATGLTTVVDNDANMAALGEKWFGVGQRHRTFLVITVEHGVGMGLVIDDTLFRGARGYGAEFGHTKVVADGAPCRCGGRGCVEAYVSDYALVRQAGPLVGALDLDDPQAVHAAIERLIAAADAGDREIATLFQRAGSMLGTAISNLYSVLDPPVVVLSGERTRAARVFFEATRAAMTGSPLLGEQADMAIEINPWGDDLWARGAAALVLEEVDP